MRQSHSSRMPILPGATKAPISRENAIGRLPAPGETVGLREHFPDENGDGAIDLVVLGESSAEGVPFQRWLSICALVEWQLETSIAARDVRLTILARSGDTLENQHQTLAGLRRRPEILIVYCGHNEFSSRFFALRDLPYYFLDQQPGGWDRLVERTERLSPVCGLIGRSADRCRIALPPPPIERELVDVPVFTPGEYSRILADFRRRLEEIVSYASNLEALPVLISPPGNDADFEPNRSFCRRVRRLVSENRSIEHFWRRAARGRRRGGELEKVPRAAGCAHPASPKRISAWRGSCGRPANGTKLTGITFGPRPGRIPDALFECFPGGLPRSGRPA